MKKSTLTLTQSGLLAVLLAYQRYKVIELARRRARREHLHAVFQNKLTRLFRVLTGGTPANHPEKHLAGTIPRRT